MEGRDGRGHMDKTWVTVALAGYSGEGSIDSLLAAGCSWKRAGMSHATQEKLILVPRPSLESSGSQLCPVPEGLPSCLGGRRLQSPACPTLITQQPLPNLGTSLRISNCAGGKCRARPIKVFPRIHRRKKEKPVPVGTRPWKGTLSDPLAGRVAL